MKNNRIAVLLLLFCLSCTVVSRAGESGGITYKPVITLFSNYHVSLQDASANSGFGLERAYLGCRFESGEWSGRVVMDASVKSLDGSHSDFSVFVKNAYVSWKKDRLRIDVGMVKTLNYAFQEEFWGYRYIMKSFGDEYGFMSSADIGISATCRITDWLDADFSVLNGKGYKKIDFDNNFRYVFGLTSSFAEHFSVRVFYDLYTGDRRGYSQNPQHTFSCFAGYRHDGFSIGGEYYHVFNNGFEVGAVTSGVSAYGTINIAKKLGVFVRYDGIFRASGDYDRLSGIRAGLEYSPVSFISISPNFYNVNVYGSPAVSYIFLNLKLSL